MLNRALLVWFALLAVAIVNGALRVAWVIPLVGDRRGHVVSTITLSAAILALAWFTIGWVRPETPAQAGLIGTAWLFLTLAFEFLGGHFLFRRPWATLFEDYNVVQGRIWVFVLLVTTLAPYVTATLRGLLHHEA